MDADLKKILRAVSLELRHTLEGTYDERGGFHPGDLENRLNALGVWRDRPAKPLSELGYLPDEDKEARRIVDAYLAFRAEAGVGQGEAVAEFVRESAYTWANRLLCLRCMEARGIIDEVVLQKEAYGWRSMVHSRLGRQDPALLATPDEGLFAVLSREFELRARELPGLFNPKAPAVALRPSLAALKKCVGLLSGTEKAGSNGEATDAVFAAPDALGWAYQYWNAEEKDRVFEKVRTERGAKIEGADIIPATQLYTEPYMVKFLVQNSLGALWMGMHPDSNLADDWEYYVRDADRAPVEQKRVQAIAFLDPACGSGHFHLEAFDLFYAMYEEEGEVDQPESICASILNHNLYGVDIDERAVQIAQATLWMKAKEVAWDLEPEALTNFHHHFVATNIRLPRGKDHLEAFLRMHPEDLPLRPALETVFAGLENAHELGTLLQLEEPVEKELRFLRGKQEEAQQEGFQSALFAGMDGPRQGKLPVGVESYTAWQDKVLSQLRADFEAEGEAADLAQAYFGQSAGKGLALFDVLARRYDIVAANPPYMHNSNFGPVLKAYIYANYPSTMQDLYAAFVARIVEITRDNGIAAFVTQHSFMFLERHLGLRERLFSATSPDILIHLGPRAFSEIGGEVVNVILFCLRNVADSNKQGLFVDLTTSDNKAYDLLRLGAGRLLSNSWRRCWQDFESVPGNPIVYRLGSEIISHFSSDRIEDFAVVSAGMVTGANARFLRFWWETPSERTPYMKGGQFLAWYGNNEISIDSSEAGFNRMRSSRTFRAAGEQHYGRRGITYSSVSAHMRARYMVKGAIWDCGGTAIIPLRDEDVYWLLGTMNSTYANRILYTINPTINIKTNDVKRLPVCNEGFWPQIGQIARQGVELAFTREESSLISRDFKPSNLQIRASNLTRAVQEMLVIDLLLQLGLYAVQETLDEQALQGYGLSKANYPEMVRPNSQFPYVDGYHDSVSIKLPRSPELNFSADSSMESLIQSRADRVQLLKEYFEREGRIISSQATEVSSSNQEDDISIDALPIPAETLLEDLSLVSQIHPLSVYWLLRRGVDQADWRCRLEEKRLAEDLFTVTVLLLLGHRWPTQFETKDSSPAWVDKDGVVPISSGGHGEASLHDRVKAHISEEFLDGNTNAIEREFAELVGEPLGEWLSGTFYSRHVSQFEKRPIAWQLETTTSGRGRGNPAFSCLVYYRRLDADLLPKIRSQYIRDLHRGYETEQRTLRQVSNRTANQDARLLQLDGWLDELNTFAEKLEQVGVSGFGDSLTVQAQLRQYAIDDAMQSLKAVWLRRLADVVTSGPLRDWRLRAEETGIHPELDDWIAAAMGTLYHHCASVGAKSPQAGKLKSDPDARALAAVIGTQVAQMVKRAIGLACDVWFGDLDSHVLRPALDEINELKALVSEQEEKLNDLGAHETRARYDVEQSIKSLKARIKKLTKARNEQRKKAKELREHIEGWTYPEAAGWTEWLGTQPLFDQFASSDEQKSPPRTIADFVAQESRYDPDINDGVRVNIAPLQKAGLLAADVLAAKDVDKAIADRADWRADERRWCREGKLPRPGWWAVAD